MSDINWENRTARETKDKSIPQWKYNDAAGSSAELWRSGNPWQCDFCFSLCIKSRCQEPSPPQPVQRLDPLCTSLPFPALCVLSNILLGFRCVLPQQLWSTCDLKEGERERDTWGTLLLREPTQNLYIRTQSSLIIICIPWMKDDTVYLIHDKKINKKKIKQLNMCDVRGMTLQTFVLHRSAGRSRVELEHADPATWSVCLKQLRGKKKTGFVWNGRTNCLVLLDVNTLTIKCQPRRTGTTRRSLFFYSK